MAQCKPFPKFGAPHFTMIPNVFSDKYLPDLTGAEAKVLVVIMRKTYGWRKDRDAISLSQLEKAAGLSRDSVARAVKSLEQEGYIIIERGGGQAINVYCLNVEESDASVTQLASADLLN